MTRVERWERNSEIPLLLLALAFLAAYAVLVIDQGLTPGARRTLVTVSWTVWVAFGVDFIVRIYLAEKRAAYARRHWYDVALIALPVLRPLRLLRLFALARILNRSAAGSLVGQVTTYAAGVAVMSVGLGSWRFSMPSRVRATRTSRHSGTRCGGPRPPSPRSVTAIVIPSRPKVA
jgi:voltage-gated potassium channel